MAGTQDKDLKQAGYKSGWNNDYSIVGWIHDEVQIATRKEIAEDVGYRFQRNAEEAEIVQLQMPIEADFKIGQTWKDTH